MYRALQLITDFIQAKEQLRTKCEHSMQVKEPNLGDNTIGANHRVKIIAKEMKYADRQRESTWSANLLTRTGETLRPMFHTMTHMCHSVRGYNHEDIAPAIYDFGKFLVTHFVRFDIGDHDSVWSQKGECGTMELGDEQLLHLSVYHMQYVVK